MKHIFLFCLAITFGLQTKAKTARYRLIWNDSPATTMTIGWDQVSGSSATVYVTTDKSAIEKPVEAKVEKWMADRIVKAKSMNNHFVRLQNLQPHTVYYFRLIDEEGMSEVMNFLTAPAVNTQRLSFIAGGDSRTFREPRVKANKMVSKLRPHGVIFAGDMTAHGTDEQWVDWLNDWQSTKSRDGRMYPIIVARGNHEHTNKEVHRIFDTPNKKNYYGIRFGGDLLHLYTLNSQSNKGYCQTRWLKKELKANQDATWHVTQYHHPVRPHIARKPEGKYQYKKWVPLFEEYNVRLSIESDSHTHKITWPIVKDPEGEEGFIRDDENGITYIGEGCWGAPLQNNDDAKSWTRHSGRIGQVKWIFVDAERIEVRTVLYDNVNEVQPVSERDIFTPPTGLKLQNYGRSTVAVIYKKKG